jgi:hypothetical protein
MFCFMIRQYYALVLTKTDPIQINPSRDSTRYLLALAIALRLSLHELRSNHAKKRLCHPMIDHDLHS